MKYKSLIIIRLVENCVIIIYSVQLYMLLSRRVSNNIWLTSESPGQRINL